MPNRQLIQRLQQAHADYIQAIYEQTKRLPGNPQGIEIHQIGHAKLFLSAQNSFKNRAILTGNETPAELQTLISHFDRKGITAYIEINQANFYRTNPFSWRSEMVPALIKLGCVPSDFRSVWYLDSPDALITAPKTPPIRRFTSTEVDAYLQDALQVEPPDSEKIQQAKAEIRQQFTEEWTHFIGYAEEEPVSLSKLLVKNKVGYLAWGTTRRPFRRQGHHRQHVQARVESAFQAGCDVVFSVTDFNIPSALSLQKAGFHLAYSYLLLIRPPLSASENG